MKNIFWLLLVCLTLCSGCARHYKITLTNSHVITTRGKPKYDKATDTFRFKDALGRPDSIPVFRVKEIEPL